MQPVRESNAAIPQSPLSHERHCETRAIWDISGFADCLTQYPGNCPHAVAFGFGCLCFNPSWQDFEVYQKRFRS
jgi:hypothetical protein